MSSLKSQLYDLIRDKGEVSYGQVVEFVLEYGAKISAAERRLRELTSPENSSIQPVMKQSKKGSHYIASYKYIPPAPPKPSFRVLSPDEVAKQYQTLI